MLSRGHYTAHLDRLTIPVHSPFWARTHRGRPVLISPAQYRLVAKVLPGWRGTQRDLASQTGYSLAGLNEAITTLTKTGVLARLSQRGRLGWTRLSMVKGVHLEGSLENVRQHISDGMKRITTVVSMYRTFPSGGPPPGPGGPENAALGALR